LGDLLPILRVVALGEVNLPHTPTADQWSHPIRTDVGVDECVGV
jgi:hypothetical protein